MSRPAELSAVSMSSAIGVDMLTGLPGRRRFLDVLPALRRLSRSLLLLNVDIDGFTAFNTLHGTVRGDALLRLFAQRLRMAAHDLDPACLVGRVGADEFAVAWPAPSYAQAQSPRLLAPLRAALRLPLELPRVRGLAVEHSLGTVLLGPSDCPALALQMATQSRCLIHRAAGLASRSLD